MISMPERHIGRAMHRPALAAVLVGAALCLAPGGARAAYPERTITMVVPFPPGGPADIIARIVAAAFRKALKQSVIVDNRGGGGGNVGIGMVARATPDGYTLLLTSTAIAVNPALYAHLQYDPIKDFAPICELVNAPNVIFVRSDSGIKTLADLIARAKAEPGTFNYASPGLGTKSQLTGEQLKLRAGIEMVHIPYRGGGPATMAVLEGTVQVGSVALAPVEPLIKDGKFTALAVTGAKRWFSLPDVPTMIESGFPRLRLRHLQRAVRARRHAARNRGAAVAHQPGGDEVSRGGRAGAPRRLRDRRRHAGATRRAARQGNSGDQGIDSTPRNQSAVTGRSAR